MLRTLFAVLGGLLLMVLVVAGMEALGHALFPAPAGTDFSDPEVLRQVIDALPVQSLALVVLGWGLGTLAGAWAAARIARQYRLSAALAIGAVMTLLVVANVVMVRHPVWMVLAGLALPLPLAFLGWRIAAGARAGRPA